MKIVYYILIFIVVVQIVSNMIYTFLSTFTSSDIVWYGGLIIASILAYIGIKQDMKINNQKNS